MYWKLTLQRKFFQRWKAYADSFKPSSIRLAEALMAKNKQAAEQIKTIKGIICNVHQNTKK